VLGRSLVGERESEGEGWPRREGVDLLPVTPYSRFIFSLSQMLDTGMSALMGFSDGSKHRC
jgi:hypothetical protein